MTTPDSSSPSLEPTAGELTSALVQPSETEAALRSDLAARIIADGEAVLRAQRAVGASTSAEASPAPLVSVAATTSARAHPARWRERSAWMLAAAASIAWLLLTSPIESPRSDAAPAALVAVRDSLASDSSSLQVAWASSTDPAGRNASGDVVWNAASQRGVMRFRGLAPNDKRTAQYQLWIVDGDRDARYPVDGGVFDVGASGEVLVPIDARLPVGRATLFAVTLEPPGGVVVSSRERLVLAAPVD
jgi:anti-sigma-K factor RskA